MPKIKVKKCAYFAIGDSIPANAVARSPPIRIREVIMRKEPDGAGYFPFINSVTTYIIYEYEVEKEATPEEIACMKKEGF